MSNEAELFSMAFAVPIISPQGIIKKPSKYIKKKNPSSQFLILSFNEKRGVTEFTIRFSIKSFSNFLMIKMKKYPGSYRITNTK